MKKLCIGIITAVVSTLSLYADPVRTAIESKQYVIVQFMKPSCPYSVYLNPLFNSMKKKTEKLPITWLLVDITGKEQYKNQYRFSTVPTVIYFKNGKEVYRHGSNDKRFTMNDFASSISRAFGLRV